MKWLKGTSKLVIHKKEAEMKQWGVWHLLLFPFQFICHFISKSVNLINQGHVFIHIAAIKAACSEKFFSANSEKKFKSFHLGEQFTFQKPNKDMLYSRV